MNITVSKEIIDYVCNDDLFSAELEKYLNAVIDEEIDKGDDMDTDLIDDCVNILDELENGGISSAVQFITNENKVIRFCRKGTSSTRIRFQRAVAAIAILAVGSAALYNASPALAQQAKDFFSYVAEALGIAADRTENENSQIKSLYGELSDDIDLTVRNENDIDLSKINVIAVYDDGSQKEIPIKNCEITTTQESEKVILIISYDGCAFSIAFEIRG
ncbi:MAG: hypothetical protein PUE08_04245 [Eubacteriales bacterium]|nr:hypothetical protein [Eubacteriales bacterium]